LSLPLFCFPLLRLPAALPVLCCRSKGSYSRLNAKTDNAKTVHSQREVSVYHGYNAS
jgi:hypothetical protein